MATAVGEGGVISFSWQNSEQGFLPRFNGGGARRAAPQGGGGYGLSVLNKLPL